MNRYFSRIGVVLVIFLVFNSSKPIGDEKEKEKILAGVILHSLAAGHYQQKNLDDAFSKNAFDAYLKSLDYNKRFFTVQDVDKLRKSQYHIDDEIKNGNYDLMKMSYTLLKKRIAEVEVLNKSILSKAFTFTAKEQIETDPDKYDFPTNKKEMEESWRKYLKFQTLIRITELQKEEDKLKENEASYSPKSFEVIEQEAREKVQKSQDTWFKRLNQLNETDHLAIYLNSILSTYDPHSNYFPPKAKENFDIQLSGKLEGIGATLMERDGYIRVEKIVPGSASWKQGDLKAGDLILKVAQAVDEPVDIVNMRLDDAVQLIRGKKGTEVRLTVKKVDGTIKVVPIIRDIVVLEETYAKSAVLKNGIKAGYIKLPQFYADFNNSGGRSCAQDVKEEIKKLQDDQIQGLVIDLRNNGGGSLRDVVEMAGLFIEKGPIVQVRGSNGVMEILEDHDPKVQYKGPLIIMVNELSASASEILAAAMQDYDRAVVVGSASTYGKGTVQRMVDLDMLIPAGLDEVKPLGAIKLTTQKFYRINGGATQLKGVIPDVVLPDDYSYLKVGEKELNYPMVWDEIKPVFYKDWKEAPNLKMLNAKSKARIDTCEIFNRIDMNAKRLKRNSEKTVFSLNLSEYQAEQKNFEEESKQFENMFVSIDNLEVEVLKKELSSLKADTSKAARVQAWHTEIKKDVYVNEAMHILQDMQ
jgi:carboxyl-terminal processing protease